MGRRPAMPETVDAEVIGEELEPLRQQIVTDERSLDELTAHVSKIEGAMSRVMRNDEHYGVIPGTKKPTLLKPGAEMLCILFRLGPEPQSTQAWDGEHLTVTTLTTLRHIPTGNFVGAASGMCSTREKRYAERKEERVCPSCGKAAIIKGREEYGGGWVCFKKKDGCGTKYQDGDPAIEDQKVGIVENPDLPDLYNTVLKMAEKRALIAAVLNATAASQIFTQDMEEHQQPAPKPVVEDQLSSDQDKLILAQLYAQKKPATIEEGAAWVESYPDKSQSRAWVARQALNLLTRPDPLPIPYHPEDGDPPPEDLERVGPEPELPVDDPATMSADGDPSGYGDPPIPGQTTIDDAPTGVIETDVPF
jgi:hypothetical protein